MEFTFWEDNLSGKKYTLSKEIIKVDMREWFRITDNKLIIQQWSLINIVNAFLLDKKYGVWEHEKSEVVDKFCNMARFILWRQQKMIRL